jgi:hypothetical protein
MRRGLPERSQRGNDHYANAADCSRHFPPYALCLAILLTKPPADRTVSSEFALRTMTLGFSVL